MLHKMLFSNEDARRIVFSSFCPRISNKSALSFFHEANKKSVPWRLCVHETVLK